MSFKLHLILAWVFMQIRCNFPDISYLSETQKNNFQFLNIQENLPEINARQDIAIDSKRKYLGYSV